MLPIERAADEQWMTPSRAARELGLSVAWVKKLVEQGKLEAERTVLGRLIDPKSVAKLKAERAK
jgi:excisionase family DNA binding protein